MNRGGMETFTMNMYRHIDRSVVQFDFLLHRGFKGDYDNEIKSLGGRIFYIRRQNPLDPFYWNDLNSFFSLHKYKVVHVQLDCLSAEPLAAAARHGVTVRVAHSHNSRQDRDLKYPLKMACKPFIKKYATDLFACGIEAGKWMFGTDNFKVIKNAIDIDAYAYDPIVRSNIRVDLGISDNAFVVGHVGRFTHVKNHNFILRVFAQLYKEHPNSVLLLAGEGETLDESKLLAGELGISESVYFLGVRSDIPCLMQTMDAFLMPSLYEGLPMVLVEAQASGLQCLISDSIPEDCDIEGRTVNRMSLEADPASWASKLVSVARVPHDRALGATVVRSAGFDASEQAARLQEFYLQRAELADV